MVMPTKIPTPWALLNKRVTIKRAVDTLDAGNGPVTTYVAFLTNIPASVQFRVGSEFPNLDGAQRAKRYAVVKVGPNLGIEPDMRLVFAGVEYNITAVRNPCESNTLTRIDVESIV